MNGLDPATVSAALRDSAGRAADLLERADPAAIAVGRWTARELGAHLAAISEYFVRHGRGEGALGRGLSDRNEFNDISLEPYLELTPRLQAERFLKNTADYADLLAEGDPEIVWMGGIRLPRSGLAGIALGEVLVHGFDLASAAGAPWSIDPEHARMAFQGLAPTLPHFVNQSEAAGFSGAFDMRMRGGPRYSFVFDNGALTVAEPGTARIDCHVSLDPVAYLMVGYGRKAPWGPMATGKMLAWGRKPWLGLKLIHLFETP